MINWRVTVATVALLGSTVAVAAQPPPHYRAFVLGGTLASVAAAGGAEVADAKTLHQRPALLQSLDWRPSRYRIGAAPPATDSVREIEFSFMNDKLYRMVIDYDRQRTEGMTDADMIEGISVLYGAPARVVARNANAPLFLIDTESGPALARWSGDGYAVVLYRSLYASSFKLVVNSPRLETLATAATVEARRLDDQEAPQRERAKQKKDAAADEKARLANKAAFKG